MRGMKKKTINQIIVKKVDKWLATIKDNDLRQECSTNVVVTGGCIASMLLGEEVNDYDIYFTKFETACKVADYYLADFLAERTADHYDMTTQKMKDTLGRDRVRIVIKSAGVVGNQEAMGESTEEVRPSKPDYAPIFLSSNAITLKGGVQLILRFFGGPEAIHENFDFIHCMNYWTPKEGVVLNPDAMEALLSKTLVYRGSLYPVCSVFRSKKFIERGWNINAGQYLKMILQINELDLKDFEILEEQLTGVDVAYFTEILNKAKSKNPLTVETAYLIEIINRMF